MTLRFSRATAAQTLINTIPTNIDTIPIHCIRETLSFKITAPNPTVTAPYNDANTLTTETCSIYIPKLLKTYAVVSSRPTKKIHQGTLIAGPSFLRPRTGITNAVAEKLVSRIIHTDGALPSSGTTRIPSNQNITPNPTAENSAHPTPANLLAGGPLSIASFTSPGTASPRATRITPTIANAIPRTRTAVRCSPLSIERIIVSTG